MSVATYAPPRLLTAEEAAELNPPEPWELIDGKVVELMPGGEEHADIGLFLGGVLQAFVRKHRLGRVIGADGGIILQRAPDTMRAADFAFTSAARMAPRADPSFAKVIPDLVAEVRSPSDRTVDVQEKIAAWLDAGVQVVWEVIPRRRTVVVHRRGQPPRTLTVEDTLDGGDLVPDFSIPVAEIFD